MEKKDLLTEGLITIMFGQDPLAFTPEEFRAGFERGRKIFPAHNGQTGLGSNAERILTAEQAQAETGIPSSWFLESARQGKIPHVRAGKYVRFQLSEVLKVLEVRRR